MKGYLITINQPTPSNNVLLRRHHTAHTAAHKEWFYLVREAFPVRIEPIQRCTVIITRHGINLLDFDNMGGGLKYLLDAMVKNKIFADDNARVITSLQTQQVQVRQKKEQKTIIQILLP